MRHILVVDDEPLMRMWLSKSIPEHSEGFDVPFTAKDGLDAINYLKEMEYDVVITDIKMPELDGLELAKFIEENYPDIIVIIILGFDDFEYARKAIQCGVKDYLLKPLVDADLAKLLDDINRRLKKQSSKPITKPLDSETDNIKTSFNDISLQSTIPVIKMAEDFIMKHFSENISLSDVADYCNINSSYLSNLFHKQLGISYIKYVTKLRMECAASYLRKYPHAKIYEIGEKLGFVSTKHFIFIFKKYYGVSPASYQKTNEVKQS